MVWELSQKEGRCKTVLSEQTFGSVLLILRGATLWVCCWGGRNGMEGWVCGLSKLRGTSIQVQLDASNHDHTADAR